MVSLVDESRWAPLIGRLFIAFGEIERTTHECINRWGGSISHKHFANARLAARIDFAIDLADAQDASEATKNAFRKAILQAKQLASHRNLVAHNPLCLVLLQDSLDQPFLEAIAHSTKDDRFLSYEELSSIVDESEKCAAEVLRSFVAFRLENFDFDAVKSFPGLGNLSS